MKRVKLIIVLILMAGIAALAQTEANDPIKVITTKNEVFYFKVPISFIGGSVEVYDRHNKLILYRRVERTKVLVDFFYNQPGNYTVVVRKGNRTVKGFNEGMAFNYAKTGPSHAERFGGDYVILAGR